MKNKFAALIAATFVATSASAGGFENQVFANDNVKAIELSQTEMKDTQGEWAPVAFAIGRGVAGGAGGMGAYHATCNPCTTKGYAGAMWGGFAGGVIGNPFVGSFAGGYIGGKMGN